MLFSPDSEKKSTPPAAMREKKSTEKSAEKKAAKKALVLCILLLNAVDLVVMNCACFSLIICFHVCMLLFRRMPVS